MNDSAALTYKAILSLSLPGDGGTTETIITLHPADTITTEDGSAKRLRDCTLQELADFADGLETEAWEAYAPRPLSDLIEANELRIEIAVSDTAGEEGPEPVTLLDHIVILNQMFTPGATSLKPVDTRDSNETIADIASDAEAQFEAAATEEHEVATETEGRTADEVGREAAFEPEPSDAEPEIMVSDSEDVYQEKEAPSETEASPPVHIDRAERIRILGRRRPLGHPTWTGVDILINETAFRDTQAHSLSSLDREVAGMLVGPQPEKQPDGRYVVHVSDAIIAKHTRMQGASVTYTPESWRYISDKLEERYPNGEAVIVGWYHTHPGFGIFLSGMDQFIHQNFFTQIWHIALVLDPVAQRSGFFCWDRPKTRVDKYEFPWPSWARHSW